MSKPMKRVTRTDGMSMAQLAWAEGHRPRLPHMPSNVPRPENEVRARILELLEGGTYKLAEMQAEMGLGRKILQNNLYALRGANKARTVQDGISVRWELVPVKKEANT